MPLKNPYGLTESFYRFMVNNYNYVFDIIGDDIENHRNHLHDLETRFMASQHGAISENEVSVIYPRPVQTFEQIEGNEQVGGFPVLLTVSLIVFFLALCAGILLMVVK